MKVSDLRKELAAIAPEHDDVEVKIWLPGSLISLRGLMRLTPQSNRLTGPRVCIFIEGNMDDGSVLGMK